MCHDTHPQQAKKVKLDTPKPTSSSATPVKKATLTSKSIKTATPVKCSSQYAPSGTKAENALPRKQWPTTEDIYTRSCGSNPTRPEGVRSAPLNDLFNQKQTGSQNLSHGGSKILAQTKRWLYTRFPSIDPSIVKTCS